MMNGSIRTSSREKFHLSMDLKLYYFYPLKVNILLSGKT